MVSEQKEIIIRPQEMSLPLNVGGNSYRGGIVEVGFGNGEFLVHLARRMPNYLVFGIEISMACIARALKRIERENIKNVRLLSGDARFLLRECFKDESIDRIYMSFPCPWPKEKHAKRRVTSRGFSDVIAMVLGKNGYFELATDEKWYAEEVAKILDQHEALAVRKFETNARREITTKYERKWLDLGKDTYLLRIEKISHYSVERIVIKEENAMHVRLPFPSLNPGVISRMQGREGGDANIHWAFRKLYFDEEGNFLMQTITTDGSFEQKFFIKVLEQTAGCLVKLDGTCRPFLTPAVRAAVTDMASGLQQS